MQKEYQLFSTKKYNNYLIGKMPEIFCKKSEIETIKRNQLIFQQNLDIDSQCKTMRIKDTSRNKSYKFEKSLDQESNQFNYIAFVKEGDKFKLHLIDDFHTFKREFDDKLNDDFSKEMDELLQQNMRGRFKGKSTKDDISDDEDIKKKNNDKKDEFNQDDEDDDENEDEEFFKQFKNKHHIKDDDKIEQQKFKKVKLTKSDKEIKIKINPLENYEKDLYQKIQTHVEQKLLTGPDIDLDESSSLSNESSLGSDSAFSDFEKMC